MNEHRASSEASGAAVSATASNLPPEQGAWNLDEQLLPLSQPTKGTRIVNTRKAIGLISLALYAAVIVLANWAISHYGFIWGPVGLVPAGTYFAGAAFVFRDFIQVTFGRWFVLAAIAAGALLSWQISPSFAVASGVAFGLGELADWTIFTPLIERGRVVKAFVLANTVGCLADTLIFLYLAFGSTAHWNTTFVGKLLLTAPMFALRFAGRKAITRWAVA